MIVSRATVYTSFFGHDNMKLMKVTQFLLCRSETTAVGFRSYLFVIGVQLHACVHLYCMNM